MLYTYFQFALFGLAAILLLVSLASIVINRANETEQAAVPATTASATDDTATPNKDPLVDAGVVPQLPADTGEPDSAAANRSGTGTR